MNQSIKSFLLYALLLGSSINFPLVAEVKLPKLISNGMILQRNQPVEIWGVASPGEEVRLLFQKHTHTTHADEKGEWSIQLPPMKAGEGYEMCINQITLKDIMVGDVFLCSGQSNMEWPVRNVMQRFGEEIKDYNNPKIRHFSVPRTYNFKTPATDLPPSSWNELNQQNVPEFSAVAYFFAKDYYAKTGVPVGLINATLGGSPAQSWMSESALEQFPEYYSTLMMFQDDEYVAAIDRLNMKANQAWENALTKSDKGLREGWMNENTNDNNWINGNLFDNDDWKRSPAGCTAGSYWLRKTVDLNDKQASSDATLLFGNVTESDFVYINGTLVGNTPNQYLPRAYKISKDILQPGKNSIAVRIITDGTPPRFAEGKSYLLQWEGTQIDLTKEWKVQRGSMMSKRPTQLFISMQPGGLYNNMIAPLKHYALGGVLWYQGESNTGKSEEYFELMNTLIKSWRNLFNNSKLPFIVVQLANFMQPRPYPEESGWAQLRNQQLRLSQELPEVGLAVCIDVGEANDIHPSDKKSVGERLSLQAQRLTAANQKVLADGPICESMKIEGNCIILSFKKGTNHLEENSQLKGFAVKDSEGKYHWANAKTEGNSVVVWSNEVTTPRGVRYAWSDNPEGANLRNKEGLPASPFERSN